MGQGRKAPRQQAMAQRQSRNGGVERRFLIAAPGVLVAIVAVVALTREPGYSGFESIGMQPAIVQVFLPG